MDIENLVNTLLGAKDAYYNGSAIMSDEDFDEMEDQLRELDPTNAYFNIVGTNVKGISKIKHSVPMLSCAKAKTIEEVGKWLDKINVNDDVVIMPKVDGLSASVEYRAGKLSCISTRGDGVIGQDVTWLKDYINVPKELATEIDIEVRGELHIPKNANFPIQGPLRNLASGLVNRKDDRENCKYLSFIAYYVDGIDFDYFDEDFKYLKGSKFYTFTPVKLSMRLGGIKDLSDYFELYKSKLRDEWLFETDGLVIQVNDKQRYKEIDSKYTINHHHFYNIALKPESEGARSTIRSIRWEVSKNGNIIPVAQFDPVFLLDREVSNATLNNYENVVNLQVCEGDTIFVKLANDVIPFIDSVKSEGKSNKLLVIDKCPSCGSPVRPNGVHIQCTNSLCEEMLIKKVVSYCIDCEMDQVAESTIRKLFENNFITKAYDLYTLYKYERELKNIDGFGDSKVTNLLVQIEKSKKQSIVQFVARLGIQSVGERAVTNLGIKTVQDFLNFNDSTYVNGQSIIEFKKNNKEYIDTMLKWIHPYDIVEKEPGMKAVMTGTGPRGRKELEKELESMGYEPSDSISKETSVLICEDINGSSSKLVKARKLGIKIVSYDEFFK